MQRCPWAEGRCVCAPDSTGPNLQLSARSEVWSNLKWILIKTENIRVNIWENLGTSGHIWTYLYSLHACLQLKLIHQFSCLNNTVAAACFTWHCLTVGLKINHIVTIYLMYLHHRKKQKDNSLPDPRCYLGVCTIVWSVSVLSFLF